MKRISSILLLLTSLVIFSPLLQQPVYGTAATGGTITTDGAYTVHTFTSSGTFTVTEAGGVNYLVVGGGGGGGTLGGGGGGAGDFRNGTDHAVSVQAYSITIGAGGAGSAINGDDGANGGSSIFDTITSTGGGGGASGSSGAGANGASGGGGTSWTSTAGGTATGVNGNDGGSSAASVVDYYGGTGGGSLTAGTVGDASCGTGATGMSTDIQVSGTHVNYAAGGASGSFGGGACSSIQGISGAGSGTGNGGNAVANTGSGGGGADSGFTGGNGGSGIVIIRYLPVPPPDAVDDLYSPSQTFGSVDLAWTQPNLNTGNLSGYQIKYDTPQTSSPSITLENNTESALTSATVSGLDISTGYSFQIGVWTEGYNGTGNILNVTTLGNFTIGSATFNQTNTSVLPITFEEQAINSTAKFLNVTYANTFTLSCDFHYKFANTNQTYSGITGTAVSTTLDEIAFSMNNVEQEIIDVYCWDTITGTDARYVLIQSDFPLLQQIENFRNGTYGTSGNFGIFDLVTLLVVIVSMIGLNRVNESVGAVFNIMFLGSLAWFEIIELPTIIFGAIAVVLVFVITSTRKV